MDAEKRECKTRTVRALNQIRPIRGRDMDVGLSANEPVTVWVHDFDGHPVITHEPDVSQRKCTIWLGKIEIVVFKFDKEGE